MGITSTETGGASDGRIFTLAKPEITVLFLHPFIIQQASTIEISQCEEQRAPKLLLTVIESPTLEEGRTFLITARGYPESSRKIRDGNVYLGTTELATDFLPDIPVSQNGPVHSLISYKKTTNGYYVKDNGHGLGTFLKIERPFELSPGHIVAFGESSLAVTAATAEQIHLKFLDGPRAEENMFY
eukprot:TRINITY_DN89047_c1_g1_i1.p2 TRINITY_DN89047_c1_g1~~TRINITY_DN89047_c1_g1_i1.p2  ORF type:complete len:185 (+),score=8.28 TRINITY_DN89047_c1_g1_i1:1224-1778(+)